jgi:hypothetical protein
VLTTGLVLFASLLALMLMEKTEGEIVAAALIGGEEVI